MRPRQYLLRDLGILLSVTLGLVLVSAGVIKLTSSKPANGPILSPVVIAAEKKLKHLIRDTILAQEPTVHASEIEGALDSILLRLTESIDHLPFDIEIQVIDTPVVNALTFPGGLIVIHAGLMKKLEKPEEMAAILAHELGHIANRDVMKKISGQIVLGALLSLGGRQMERVAQRIVQQIVNIHFSRAIEMQADEFRRMEG